jgi:hypothetical protein
LSLSLKAGFPLRDKAGPVFEMIGEPMRSLAVAATLALAVAATPALAQNADVSASYTYADLADLTAISPLVADVVVTKATRLKGPDAPDLAPGKVRFFVQGNVMTLIKGANGLPGDISYLVDLPLDSANRPPKLRKARFLLMAAPVPGKPSELRLVGPDASPAWTPELDQRLRAVLKETTAPDAPPRITGIAKAFYVPGSLPGESETQIFLTTDDSRPVSLSILRRPGEQPRWAVALGELVDEAAAPPAKDTLLWYRLACFLPATLPDSALVELSSDDAQAARADYGVVIAGLGPCERHHVGK